MPFVAQPHSANMDHATPLPSTASPLATLEVDRRACSIKCRITIACSPATLYRVWSDVAHWHLWDPDTKSAALDGPFTAGSAGRITPQKGPAARMVLSYADPAHGFTAECPVLGSRMLFPHTFTPMVDGLLVSHAVHMEGWLRRALMWGVGRGVERGLPLTLTRLKAYCEAMERGTWPT
jgi:hypothetical protein